MLFLILSWSKQSMEFIDAGPDYNVMDHWAAGNEDDDALLGSDPDRVSFFKVGDGAGRFPPLHGSRLLASSWRFIYPGKGGLPKASRAGLKAFEAQKRRGGCTNGGSYALVAP